MKRFLGITLLSFILATLVGAQGNAPRISASDQAALLKKNRDLLKVTVENGLDLTSREGPLERAEASTKLAGEWSKAIQAAASAKDTSRVQELGKHFGTVVNTGVVSNLQKARSEIASGSERERTLLQRRDEALQVLKVLEEALHGDREFETVVQTIRDSGKKLEQATKR